MRNSHRVEAIVLKRHNYSDSDRFITLFSNQKGKISCLAKGVRKISSRKRPALEIGNQVQLMYTQSKSTNILTQAQLINSFPNLKQDLTKITQTYQILEIVDLLTAEEENHPNVYHQLKTIMHSLHQDIATKTHILNSIKAIVTDLGFGLPQIDTEENLKLHLESIAEKNLRSKAFLTLNNF